LVDPHLDASDGGLRFGYIAIARAPRGAKNAEVAIYAQLPARDFLQPFLGAWLFQNAKGGGLLARREGEDLVPLNGLPGEESKLISKPYATSTLPAAVFIRGEAHAMRGIGANGAPVVAAGQKVPGTDWEMVAWIDEADALAGLDGIARMAGLLASFGVAASWIIAAYLWQNQRFVRARAGQRLSAAFEHAPIGMGHVGLDGRLLRVNQRLCEIFGYPREELLTLDLCRLNKPAQRAEATLQLAKIWAGASEEYTGERQYIRKDGIIIDVALSVTLVRGEADEPDYLMSVFEDITLRKNHEAILRLAAVVFTSTREGVVVTDVNENILMVNPAFERITGYDEASMLGKTMRLVQSGRHEREFYQAMWRGIQENGYYCGEIWNKRKNGEIYPQLATISAVFASAGEITNYIGVFSDIGQLKQSETRLEFFAHHDALTLFPNRLLLRLRIENAIERARRDRTTVAVLVLDLDRFKTVNESLGHSAGDQLLVDVAARWSKRLGASDTLARIGGDEFVVLLENIPEPQAAETLAQKLIEATAAHFALPGGRDAFVGLSVGVSLFPANGDDAEALIQHAGSALDVAKQSGGSTVRFYSEAMTREASCRLELEAGLRRGLERDEFVLQFQPLISLADRKIVGVEALTRWRSPSGLIPPDQFISIAEQTGLIVPLGDWVLRTACGSMKAWRNAGVEIGVIAVNLSPIQLDRQDICRRIQVILEETGLPPHCLEIEITESALLEQRGDPGGKLAALKALGLRISIDDFGAGHSSLFYLKRFPIDKLKLDRSFIVDIPADPTSMEIAAAIVHLAQSLKVDALAEGVETEEQVEFLKACGCKLAQGYLFDKPLYESELLAKYGAGAEGDVLPPRSSPPMPLLI
jgi:diguanylate cyclase (GGDEF)-like protein/PAS domain S-box-containing protein